MESFPDTTWQIYPLLSKRELQAAETEGIDPLYTQLLSSRGVTDLDEVKAFVRPSYEQTLNPLALIDIPRAVECIHDALENKEHITVYGDYDADGVTSSSLLYRALRTLKHSAAPLDFHIPHRLSDGCGLNVAALNMLYERGTRLIITTDCASSDVEQVAYANQLGIDIIITDHHNPPVQLPQAYAMVNAWRPDASESDLKARYLCGAGMAFKLVQALYRSYNRPQGEEMDLLDLVAIGTVADIAPLLGENHLLVRLGMQRLNRTQKPGLKALIRNANLQPGRIRERDIAYALAPRINAAGRMKDASIAFHLMTTESEEEAAAYVAELEWLNVSRQQQTEELMRNVREQAQLHPSDQIILVSGDDWHEGILGLVAGKLVEEINKPVLVLSNDPKTSFSRGSARSQKGFNVIEALRGFSDRLERYGGHAQAAGFTIQRERIDELRTHLLGWKARSSNSVENGTSTGAEETASLVEVIVEHEVPALMVDLVLTKTELLNYRGYKKIRELSPFGAGNPEPIFKMKNLRLLDKWTSGVNKQNLRLKLAVVTSANGVTQITGTLTKGAARLGSLKDISHVDIIFRIESSEDESRQDIWLKILDVRKAE